MIKTLLKLTVAGLIVYGVVVLISSNSHPPYGDADYWDDRKPWYVY